MKGIGDCNHSTCKGIPGQNDKLVDWRLNRSQTKQIYGDKETHSPVFSQAPHQTVLGFALAQRAVYSTVGAPLPTLFKASADGALCSVVVKALASPELVSHLSSLLLIVWLWVSN